MFAQSSVCTLCRFNTGSINSAPISRSRENFCRIKKPHYLSESGVFYFPAGRKKAEYDRFRKSIDPASWNQAKECARGKSRKAKFVNQSGL